MLAISALHNSEIASHSQLSDSVQKVRQYLLNFSPAKFAAKLGVSLPSINRWEHGRATPSPIAAQPIERLLYPMGEAGKQLLVKYFSE